MQVTNKPNDENLINDLIVKLLVRPTDEQFVDTLNKFSQTKQLTKFHRLLFSQQIEVQQNLAKRQELIERLQEEWTVDQDEQEDRTTEESEITYQFLYSTHFAYSKQIVSMPFSQKLDIWSIFLEQDLNTNQLCLQLFSTFLLHFDVSSSKITPIFQSKLDELIERTNGFFERNVNLRLISNAFNLIRWLELIYNWGQFQFIYKIYSKNKSIQLINTESSCKSLGPYNLEFLHTYKDTDFWQSFLKQCLNKEEKNLEITELAIRLVIQNLIYHNTSAITPHHTDSALESFNQESSDQILESIGKYPNLVFYLNIEQFYELFSDHHLELMFSHLTVKFIECKESKYSNFLSQGYFKGTKRVQVVQLRVFIKVLNDLCLENNVQNLGFLNLLESILQKDWPLDVYSTCVPKDGQKNEFWKDLTEIATKLDSLTPVKGFQDKRIHNLISLLDQCLPLNDLLFGNQCLALIVFIGLQSSFILDTQLSVPSLDCFTKLIDTPQQLRLFDVYSPSSFVKKLFVILTPFSVNSILGMINTIVSKLIFRITVRQDDADIKHIFMFFTKLDARSNKPNHVEELEFVLRTILLIELNKHMESKKKKHRKLVEFMDNDELRILLAGNIDECIKQLDRRLQDESYSKLFKVNCIQGVFQFFNARNVMNEFNFEKYFDLSIRLTFECIYELSNSSSLFNRSILFNYLTFLFKNEMIYSVKITKLDLIQQVWNKLIFKHFGLEFVDDQANVSEIPDFEMFSEQLVNGSSKRKLNEAQQSNVKRMKRDDLNVDVLFELIKITLHHCSCEQLNQLLTHILNNLRTFNSEFLSDSIDFADLTKKVNLLVLIKIVAQNISGVVSNEKDKLELFKDEFIQNLIIQVVNFAQNIYKLRMEIRSNFECEEIKTDERIKANDEKLEDLRNKMNKIHEIQVLLLEIVESFLSNFRSLGNFTSQQVNYLAQVCVLSDLNSYQENDPKLFASIFNRIYMILNRILIDYPHTVVTAFSAYMNMVINLLQNLCRVGFQVRFLSLKPETQLEIEKCSIDCQHLLVLIAKTKEYNKCIINLISTLIDEMQKDIVYSTIKNRILIGIYKLLNSSQSDNKIQFIYSRLSQEGRQMFKQIYDNYDKFYRYKGYA